MKKLKNSMPQISSHIFSGGGYIACDQKKNPDLIVVCFLRLADLPPAVSILKELSQKYFIKYIGVDPKTEYYDELFDHKVDFYNIIPYECSNVRLKSINKIRNSLYRKKMIFWYRNSVNVIKKYCSISSKIWILHEFTIMNLGPRILEIPYYLTMYELHSNLFITKENILKKYIRTAQKIIVPEYMRAAIVRACVGLKNMPYVIPNKPYEYSDAEIKLENNKYIEIAKKIHCEGKKIILYTGIFLRERKLETIIDAVDKMKDKYQIVLIGQKSEYLEELLQKYPSLMYWGFVKAPKHLSLVKLADIGIMTYVSDTGSINPVFCAPNKIWEYAKYGLPMLCNDIPGLKFSVEYNNMGVCCDIDSVDDVIDKINYIDLNYSELSLNALRYYDSIDIMRMIDQIVERV